MCNVCPLKRFGVDQDMQQRQGVSDRAGSTLSLRLSFWARFNEFVITLMSEGQCLSAEGDWDSRCAAVLLLKYEGLWVFWKEKNT